MGSVIDIESVIERLEILSKDVEALNYGRKFPFNLSIFIDNFQKNENLKDDIQVELACYGLTDDYYGGRSEEQLIELHETRGGGLSDRLMRDLKPIAEKYHFKLLDLHGEFLDRILVKATLPYIPITRWEDEKLIGGENELIDAIDDKITIIQYPFAQFNLNNYSNQHYAKYREIISYWIFLNIAQLIQMHTGLSQRTSNEIATFIVNQVAHVKRSRSAYEKAAAKHVHPKAHGVYFYEYYGSKYANDLTLLRKVIKFKNQTFKTTSFKNLKNIIRVTAVIDDSIVWNILDHRIDPDFRLT